MSKNILWLASWYPNILNPYDGDFIQRHARAVALFQKITLVYIKKDEKGSITKDVKITSVKENNLNEIIVYYHSLHTGFGFIDQLFSSIKYKKVYRQVLKNYIDENGRPDIVHLHVALKAGLQALWLKKNFGIPYLLSEHWSGYFPEGNYGVKDLRRIKKNILKKILASAEKITVVSGVLGVAISNLFKIEDYIVVPNVVNTTLFYPEKIVENEAPVFIHISSLQYEKNIRTIIEAFRLISAKGLKFQFLIYGPIIDELKQLVVNEHLQEFIILKKEVPQSELASQLRKSDALILYSHYETFGCVVIEANACGIPVILSDLPVFKEYITEFENGIFAGKDDSAVLASKLENFIMGKYHFDKQLIAEKTAGRFNYNTVGKQFIAIYENLLIP